MANRMSSSFPKGGYSYLKVTSNHWSGTWAIKDQIVLMKQKTGNNSNCILTKQNDTTRPAEWVALSQKVVTQQTTLK